MLARRLPEPITQVVFQCVELLLQNRACLRERVRAELRFRGIELLLTSIPIARRTTARKQGKEATAYVCRCMRANLTERCDCKLRVVSRRVEHPLRESAVVHFRFEHPDRQESAVRMRES